MQMCSLTSNEVVDLDTDYFTLVVWKNLNWRNDRRDRWRSEGPSGGVAKSTPTETCLQRETRRGHRESASTPSSLRDHRGGGTSVCVCVCVSPSQEVKHMYCYCFIDQIT